MQSNNDLNFKPESAPQTNEGSDAQTPQRSSLDLGDHLDSIELVLGRVVDAEDSSDEWYTFIEHADRRPGLWRELACQQRDARRLMRAVGARTAPALTALPDAPPDARTVQTPWRTTGRFAWTRNLGWAAAAAVGLSWGLTATVGPARSGDPQTTVVHRDGNLGDGTFGRHSGNGAAIHNAALVSADAPSGAYLDAYLDLGQREGVVVGELPTKYLIESRELGAGGGFEVLFVRPIVERRVVPAMYGFERSDEFSEPRIVPVGSSGVL